MTRKFFVFSVLALGVLSIVFVADMLEEQALRRRESAREDVAKTALNNDWMFRERNAFLSAEGIATDTVAAASTSSSGASALPRAPLCAGALSGDFSCYEAYYRDFVARSGIKAAFADLRARYGENAYVRSQCHPLTHVIGQSAAEKFPDVSEAFKNGDVFCWSGYYHGVMEGVIGKIGRDNIVGAMDGICAPLRAEDPYRFDHYNCVHGLGHGVMGITDSELFEALDYCGTLSDPWEEISCTGGVFMENIIIDGKNHFTKYLRLTEPLYPCNAVADRYKLSCYLMQTSYMLKVSDYDFGKVFALCRAADAGYEDTCYQSLGRDASGQSISNVKKTKDTCMLGRDFRERSNCAIGAVKDFISYYHSDTKAKEFCAAFDPDIRSVCASTVESYYTLF